MCLPTHACVYVCACVLYVYLCVHVCVHVYSVAKNNVYQGIEINTASFFANTEIP